MSGNSRFQLFPKTLQLILSKLGLGTLFFLPNPNPKVGNTVFQSHFQSNIWEHCFSIPFPIPISKKIYLEFYCEIRQSICTLFQQLWSNLPLIRIFFLKLNNKYELAQLGSLNIVLNVERHFMIPRCIPNFLENQMQFPFHSQMLGIKFSFPLLIPKVGNLIFIPNPKILEFDFLFPFPIPNVGNRLGHLPILNVQKSFPLMLETRTTIFA